MRKIYENILADFEDFIKISPVSNNSVLCSFAFQFENTDWLSFVTKVINDHSDISFFKTANNQQANIGVNSAVSLHTPYSNKFSSVSKNFDRWGKCLINNWGKFNKYTAPMIFCSAKFDANNSSSLWEEFNPIRIYIPEFIIEIDDNKAFGYFNFVPEEKFNKDSLSSKLQTYLGSMIEPIRRKPDTSTIISSLSFDDAENFSYWTDTFQKALKFLDKEEINKLVLSRTFNLKIENSINWHIILAELHQRFPDCYLFLLKKNDSIFFGSSPEMFLKVSGNKAEVESVAGSAARGLQTESDKELEKFLKTSEKNHKEHIIVSDFISDILIKYSNNVHVIEEKQIRKLDNIQHLITRISAELNSGINTFELIDSLFPTPAVCGVPKEKAMQIIKNLETHDRGLYSGLVGIFDFEKNCEIAVAIRSALVKENLVTAFAGAGIIKDSDMKEEFLEIKLKLGTILSLFTDENKN